MPPRKRKQAAAVKEDAAPAPKKQKQDGQKALSRDIEIRIDEGFSEWASISAKFNVYIDESSIIYDASLNQTNIGGNNNKFYRLQLLQVDNGEEFYTHTRWGRVGEFGQVKTKGPSNLETALKEYRKKFKDKSGLDWEKRNDEPKSGKYTFIEKNYDSDDGEDASANIETNEGLDAPVVPCKLPLKTQRLMELIFNENHFNSVLQQIGYNANKLPLGKLGKSTLKKGFEHLKELSSLINQPSLAQSKHGLSHHAAILDFSNKYYSTIPHDFGRCNPPPINNDDILKREVEMLDTLTDMEVANSIMKSGSAKVSKDAEAISIVDKRFNDLGMAEMTALDHGSQEYQELKEYLVSSSGATHGLLYRLEDIFRIERRGEEERFAQSKFSKLKDKNRLLLWHGSRTTNFGGILSQGLRIAPPEAPMNGYAFGKGIYMADCSSKSANYCLAGMSGGVGLLLLCEAELSNPTYEIACGDSNAQQMAEKHNCISTKGVGRTVPQKWKDAGCVNEKLKGVMMPDGPPGDNKNHQSGYLLYNEYIAYSVEQVRLRYLLRVGL